VCVYVCAYVSRLWVCTVLARYQMKTPDWNGTTVVLDTLSKRDDFEFEKSGVRGPGSSCCKNFVASAALVEVCGLLILLVLL